MTAAELKASILELAIRGKLVAQDSNDEPASSVLKKISPEMLDLACDVPFDIPSGWAWVCHNSIINISGGAQPPKAQFVSEPREGYVRLYQIRDYGDNPVPVYIPKKTASKTTHKGDILLARYGGSLGKVFWAEEGAYNVAMAKVIVHDEYEKFIDQQYVYLYYHTDLYRKVILKNGRSAQAGFNKDDLRDMLFPLPPLAEQKRIVEKVEELMPLVDRYEKAEAKRIELEKALPGDLEKSILQEAIQGKLVEQDPNDEPASELLARIAAEKAKLIKEKKIKKEKPLDPIDESEVPFVLPKGWAWCRLRDVVYNHGQKKPTSEFSYIDIGSIDNKNQRLNDVEIFVQPNKASPRARKIVKQGDIVYSCVRPYLHNVAIVDREFAKEPIASTGFAVLATHDGVFNKYLFYYLLSPSFDEYANDGDNAKGIGYPAISDGKLYAALVPLPPLAEQKRIVAKVDELLGAIRRLH